MRSAVSIAPIEVIGSILPALLIKMICFESFILLDKVINSADKKSIFDKSTFRWEKLVVSLENSYRFSTDRQNVSIG
jgi:hypothetical protein